MNQKDKSAKYANVLYGAAAGAGAASPNASPATLSASNDARELTRQQVRGSLYLLCKGVLGYNDFHPVLHKRICELAQDRATRRSVHLWPRDHYKTSVFSVGLPIFEYINDSNLAILLAASTATNASRRLRRIQGVFERNKLFQWLFPELIPQDFNKRWNEQEALCPREEDKLEPTFDTVGVGGKITGRHYNIKITDDMVDETCLDSSGLPSDVAMDSAKQWFDYCEFLLESEYSSRDIVVGTRWAREDPYAHIETDKRYVFNRHAADGGCCADHPAGLPIFPQGCNRCSTGAPHTCKVVGFTTDYLHVLQKKDPYKYALQMRNDPIDPTITEFKREWVRHLEFTSHRGDACVKLGERVVRLADCNSYLIIDPAFTKKKKNDPTGFLLGAVAPSGDFIVLYTKETRLDPKELVDGIFEQWMRWRPHEVLVEAVAGAKFIEPFLREKSIQEDIYIRVREVKPGSNESKMTRIRGLVTPLSHGQLWIAPAETEFVNQLLSYPSSRDHLLDCAAYLFSDTRRPFSDDELDEGQAVEDALLKAMNRTTGY
jgi:hypothetical protein